MEIAKLRKRKKMTQKEFAEYYGMPLRTVQKWERHGSNPLSYLVEWLEKDINREEFCDISKLDREPQTKFHIINKKRFLNNNKIHPLQQNNVEQIIEELKKYVEVKKIIVFGSSTKETCNYESDVDIYAELDKDINVKTYSVDVPVDFWTNFNVDPRMKEEIMKEGVVVYDR